VSIGSGFFVNELYNVKFILTNTEDILKSSLLFVFIFHIDVFQNNLTPTFINGERKTSVIMKPTASRQ
jgi:hypothetical protein